FNIDENFGNDDNHRDNLDEMLHDAEKLLHEAFPEDNELPVTTYHAKKLTCPVGLAVERIHACRNDCILYKKDYKDIHECPVCKASRYKHHKNLRKLDSDVTKNGPPAKMLWYLPIIPRLKKLYANPKDAKLLRWHAKERKTDGKMRHVADSPQWKNIDRDFKKFGSEIRNIRFGLCSDGINPFKILSSRHSTWPVLLSIYNLPPWLCMKRKYIMMSLLIQGPKQPGNDINVYLRPLIDDMIDLWETGVEIYDVYKKERFHLFAMIYCTTNDFPAYGNLSGYGTKWEKACPVCENGTHSRWLTNCRKTIYMGHRRALHEHHPYRKKENIFDDGVNARKDMLAIGIRSELAPQETNGKKYILPPACYTLSKAEKTSFSKCLHGIKVPSGYSANIKNLVSMKDLKLLGYVRNRYRPEGSIIQGYVAKEVVQFCTNYMDDVTDIGLPQPQHQGRLEGMGTIGRKDVTPNTEDLEQAHFTVMQNITCIEPYIQEQMSYLARKNDRREQRWLEAEHKKTFSQWLADKVIGHAFSPFVPYPDKLPYAGKSFVVPSGYSANIKNLVSMKDLKLLGMKSHDCHVLLMQMITIAIRGLMPP
nr:hypothetical protein [Tanacetum cinerariifolium]